MVRKALGLGWALSLLELPASAEPCTLPSRAGGRSPRRECDPEGAGEGPEEEPGLGRPDFRDTTDTKDKVHLDESGSGARHVIFTLWSKEMTGLTRSGSGAPRYGHLIWD